VRGQVLSSPFAGDVFVTIHPSYILRLQDSEDREREFAAFVQDLLQARQIAYGR
jgi:DNA polymerase